MDLHRQPELLARWVKTASRCPIMDAVHFEIIPDDATRILKLQSGESRHAAELIPFSRVAELKADANLTMELFPSTRIIYCADQRARKAGRRQRPTP
jgi:peptide/nickel transport system substrate-binding protein